MIILPIRSEINQETIDKLVIKPIYISRTKRFYELKDKLANIICKLNDQILVNSNLRFWKVSAMRDSELDLVKNFLSKNANEILNKSKSYENENFQFLESINI